MNIFDLLEQCPLTKNNYSSKDKVQNDDKVEPCPNNGESAKTKLQLRPISSFQSCAQPLDAGAPGGHIRQRHHLAPPAEEDADGK